MLPLPSYHSLLPNREVMSVPRPPRHESCEMAYERVGHSLDEEELHRLVLHGAKKRSLFSDRIIHHGLWRDTSLDAETRRKSREAVREKRKVASMNRINAAFDKECDKIRQLQEELSLRQKKMALIAMEKYLAVRIQTCFRAFSARKALFLFKKARFIAVWFYHSFLYKNRKVAAKRITDAIRRFFSHRAYRILISRVRAARKITVMSKLKLQSDRAKRDVARRRVAVTFLNHKYMMGMSRATKKIVAQRLSEEEQLWNNKLDLYRRLLGFYRRRKRKEMLKGPWGKRVFYIIQQLSFTGQWTVEDMLNAEEEQRVAAAAAAASAAAMAADEAKKHQVADMYCAAAESSEFNALCLSSNKENINATPGLANLETNQQQPQSTTTPSSPTTSSSNACMTTPVFLTSSQEPVPGESTNNLTLTLTMSKETTTEITKISTNSASTFTLLLPTQQDGIPVPQNQRRNTPPASMKHHPFQLQLQLHTIKYKKMKENDLYEWLQAKVVPVTPVSPASAASRSRRRPSNRSRLSISSGGGGEPCLRPPDQGNLCLRLCLLLPLLLLVLYHNHKPKLLKGF